MAGPGRVRQLAARWVVMAMLRLETAAHLGNGARGDRVDMPLFLDPEGRPLLTGSSLAGALRSLLADRLLGYRQAEDSGDPAAAVAGLFGGTRGDDDGVQSPLVVYDSRGQCPDARGVEIRDGVAIDPTHGTAAEHKKYDLEVLPAGTCFPLRLDLLVPADGDEQRLLGALAAVLEMAARDLCLGARRSRGFGRTCISGWRAHRFDLSSAAGWKQWLASDHEAPIPPDVQPAPQIAAALAAAWPGLSLEPLADRRRRLHAVVDLELRSSLLVRSPGTASHDPDDSHLASAGQSVLPGTSVAGALRARALRVAAAVCPDGEEARRWVDRIFGPMAPDQGGVALSDSRLRVSEAALAGGIRLRQSRIRIDRFTGGALGTALFEEEPHFGGHVRLELDLVDPQPGEAGLLLLVLKDLITGDLPLGGAAAVGRGVFRGTARITLPGAPQPAELSPGGTGVTPALEQEVAAFVQPPELGSDGARRDGP